MLNEAGGLKLKVETSVQEFASVIVTVAVPAHCPTIESIVAPVDHA